MFRRGIQHVLMRTLGWLPAQLYGLVVRARHRLYDAGILPSQEGALPTLVLGNKNDLPESVGVDELIDKLNLKSFTNREVRDASNVCNELIDELTSFTHREVARGGGARLTCNG